MEDDELKQWNVPEIKDEQAGEQTRENAMGRNPLVQELIRYKGRLYLPIDHPEHQIEPVAYTRAFRPQGPRDYNSTRQPLANRDRRAIKGEERWVPVYQPADQKLIDRSEPVRPGKKLKLYEEMTAEREPRRDDSYVQSKVNLKEIASDADMFSDMMHMYK